MFRRKIFDELVDWARGDRKKALCIIGARQIGKTTIVRELAKQEFEELVELNFLTDEKAKGIFDGSLDGKSLVLSITAFAGKNLIPHKTLILLDEIQACPRARTAIKFLVEEGSFAYAETGSLLGVNIEKVESYPVGFEKILYMYPMDFEEFAWANQTPELTLNHLKECYEQKKPVNETVHQIMLEMFRRYLVVGGMPDVVHTFLTTNDIARTIDVQRSLLTLFRSDIAKYARTGNSVRILKIFDSIPSQLDDKNRRYMISQVFPKSRLMYLEDSFNWLTLAGIALPCYNLTAPQLPFQLNEKKSLFKLYFLDTGLLCAMIMDNVQFAILQGDSNVNQGSILENVFACEFKSHGYPNYYYNSNRLGEIDFVINENGTICYVEIKSGNDWTRHKALDHVMQQKDWKFGKAIVFCKGNLQAEGDILYLPWYMSMFIENKPVLPGILEPLNFDEIKL